MPEITALQKGMAELTEVQRKAAEWGDGALLVLAGPGSGKTRVLTCRIARLLDNSRDNTSRVLGLTFTNKAADEMRTRVEALVPGMSNRLFLGTFHSFCAEILRQQGAHIGIKPDFRIYGSTTDLEKILRDAVGRLMKRELNIRERDAIYLPVIQRLKSELVSPKEAASNVPEGEIREKIGLIYAAYEDELRSLNVLDFNSLIYYTHELFARNPILAKRFRSVYPYWCIDEFQDSNKAQFQLLNALAGGEFSNVFVVADDDQIIYQWNGASFRRFEEFKAQFHPEVLQLPTNYRCPPEIVEMANRLIQHNVMRAQSKMPLEAARLKDNKLKAIRILRAKDQDQEASHIAKIIENEHSDSLNSVVVLARNRRLLDLTKGALSQRKIKALIAQRKDEFSSPQLIWLHHSLELAASPRDISRLTSVASAFYKLTGVEVNVSDVVSRADATTGNYFGQWLDELIPAIADLKIRNICSICRDALVRSHEHKLFVDAALLWLDSLDSSSDEIYREDREAWDEIVNDTARAIGPTAALEPFLQEIELRSKSPTPGKDCVALMTIHGAKGKEFEHVILQGVVEDMMPSFQSKKKGPTSAEMEEERRNCFVAITRAKTGLILSFAENYFGYSKEPSRFLTEMGLARFTTKR